MLISALAFALMAALVKEAGQLGIPLLQIIFVRALISVALSLIDIARAGVHPLGHRRVLLFARGLSGFLALTGVFYALIHLTMAQATVLQYLHPVFTALLAFLFLAERPTTATLACIALSLLGLTCIVSPYWVASDATSAPLWPVIAGLGGAFGSGVAYTLVRKLVTTEHPSVIVLYFPLVCAPGTLIVGWGRFCLANGGRLVGVIGGRLLYPIGANGAYQGDATGCGQPRHQFELCADYLCSHIRLVGFWGDPHSGHAVGWWFDFIGRDRQCLDATPFVSSQLTA